MRKIVCMALALCLALTCFGSMVMASDDSYVVVMLDDQEVESDATPFIANDRTLVGLRGIFEQMGAKVEWNGEERSVVIEKEDREVKLFIDNKTVSVKQGDETREIETDVAPKIAHDRTYVPLRFIAETFDCTVDYYADETSDTKIAIIYTPEYGYTNLKDLFESTYDVTPLVDETLPAEENTYYYELTDALFLPMGVDHLIKLQNQVVKNFRCTYAYDDVTGWFADGGYVCNKYTFTKYNESITISLVTDPRAEESNEEAHFVVVDKVSRVVEVIGNPIIKVVYSN